MDIVDPSKRSKMMSGIRGKNTKPELQLRSLLHRHGFRFRIHGKELPGKPDLVLSKYKTVIFVHGCFWHQHPGCKYAYMPKSNVEFWQKKLLGNRQRDMDHQQELTEKGWNVITVWECEIKDITEDPQSLIFSIQAGIDLKNREL